jgi:muramoyltetrapeptide carboxypeptidase
MTTSDRQIPARLRPGSTIGVVAPASGFDRTLFTQGLQYLQNFGFETVVPETVFDTNGYLAGSDSQRARQINRMFANPDIDAIICARGGYGAMRILPLLDYELIGQNPKLFMGFSDITVLLNTLYKCCRLVTVHSPVVTSLAVASNATRQAFMKVISSAEPLTLKASSDAVIRSGLAEGPVLGGNLTLLAHLQGTPFAPDFEGAIVLLEDQGEAPYRIDRMLTQLKLAGAFARAAGIVLGSFNGCGDDKAVLAVFEDVLADVEVPILSGLGVGHDRRNLTLPIGQIARLDTKLRRLAYQAPATRGT